MPSLRLSRQHPDVGARKGWRGNSAVAERYEQYEVGGFVVIRSCGWLPKEPDHKPEPVTAEAWFGRDWRIHWRILWRRLPRRLWQGDDNDPR